MKRLFALSCAVAFGFLAACNAKPQTPSALDENGNLKAGYQITTQGLTAAQNEEFSQALVKNNGELDLKALSPALRDALVASATKVEPEARRVAASLPAPLQTHAFSSNFTRAQSDASLQGMIAYDGKRLALVDLKDGYTIATIWATNCAPCIVELKDFAALARANNRKVRVIAIQSERPSDDLETKTKAALSRAGNVEGLEFWREVPSEQTLIAAQAKALPTTLLIGPDGQEIGRVVGFQTTDGTSSVWASQSAQDFLAKLSDFASNPI
jgi:thiol-disulfide isomerase/thioredoxin